MPSLWQAGGELGVLGLFVWAWGKTLKRDAIEETRDGISAAVWRKGMKDVGPLGRWQDSKVAAIQRRLDALTHVHGQRR